jgi:hypothetical protein
MTLVGVRLLLADGLVFVQLAVLTNKNKLVIANASI